MKEMGFSPLGLRTVELVFLRIGDVTIGDVWFSAALMTSAPP